MAGPEHLAEKKNEILAAALMAEMDKIENDLNNMYIIFNPKELKNIKIIDDDDKIIIKNSDINELYKKLCTVNNINE